MPQTSIISNDFSELETRLFAWDADDSTRSADAFVRGEVRGIPIARGRDVTERYPLPFRVPALPGSYARLGGETVILRSNDAALALARKTPRAA